MALFTAQPCAASFTFNGYAKSLNFLSRESGNRWLELSGNRLRLNAAWQNPSQSLDASLISDEEFLYGSLLRSQRRSLDANLGRNEFMDMDWTLNEKENTLWRHVFYRAWARARWKELDFTVGRQRFAWGQGRLWNPTDVINPYNPLSVERDERPGSDTAHIKWTPLALAFVEAVYAPRRKGEWDHSLLLGRARMNWREVDWGVMGGKRADEGVAGFDWAAQILDGSLRGEYTHTFGTALRGSFSRAVLSYDYNFNFSRSLYLLGELYYNGLGKLNEKEYPLVPFKAGDQSFSGQRYFGFGSSYELTALLKFGCYGIVNLTDGSAFLNPNLGWQPVTDLEFSVGYQAFTGHGQSEFGRARDITFFQVQWFFSMNKN